MTAANKILAWHFVSDTLRDGRSVPADGEVLRHDGPMELCRSGLHASVKCVDALGYAPGYTLCRVECSCDVEESDDKLICRERVILNRADSREMLRAWARWCALRVTHLWDSPEVVVEYLTTGDESKRDAAWAAARSAAWNAAWNATWNADRDADRDAAWAAARAAARNAAWDATRDAARDAALVAARAAARAAARNAAWDAARDAVMAAARDAQSAQLEAMALEAVDGRDSWAWALTDTPGGVVSA